MKRKRSYLLILMLILAAGLMAGTGQDLYADSDETGFQTWLSTHYGGTMVICCISETAHNPIDVYGGYAEMPDGSGLRKDGMLFAGWYTDPAGGIEVTSSTLISPETFPDEYRYAYEHFNEFVDILVYPHWKPLPAVTLTLYMNGGDDPVMFKGKTCSVSKLRFKEGQKQSCPIPQRDHHAFMGWSTVQVERYEDLDVKDPSFYRCPNYEDENVEDHGFQFTEDQTLYAVWLYTGKPCLITFDVNQGNRVPTGAVNLKNMTNYTTTAGYLTTLPEPVIDYYTFTGWYTERTGGTRITLATRFKADTTIYAHWVENQRFKVIFDANGGTVASGAKRVKSFTASTALNGRIGTLPSPSRSGYDFTGWYTAKTGGTRITTQTVFKKNQTVYARWKAQKTDPGKTEDGKTDTGKPDDGKTDPGKTEEKPQAVVTRIAGADRYVTSREIAKALKNEYGVSKFAAVVIADGRNYPDALASSYLAVRKKAAIILTEPTQEQETVQWVKKNVKAKGSVYIAGGTGSVRLSIERSLRSAGFSVLRLGGKDRYETNMKILREAKVGYQEILVTTGLDFADSLSASGVALPILLVRGNGLTADQKLYLKGLNTKKYTIIGGTDVVSAGIAKDLAAYGKVARITGKTPYDRSVRLAAKFANAKATAILLAPGEAFPDGLCGGPLAALSGKPMLLSASKQSIYGKAVAFTKSFLASRPISGVTVFGGSCWISDKAARTVLKF